MVGDWTMAEMIEHDQALTPCRFFPFSPICKQHHRVSKPALRQLAYAVPKIVQNGDHGRSEGCPKRRLR
jgi:hypothetical protein